MPILFCLVPRLGEAVGQLCDCEVVQRRLVEPWRVCQQSTPDLRGYQRRLRQCSCLLEWFLTAIQG